MRIRLLNDGYLESEELYNHFIKNSIDYDAEYFSNTYIDVDIDAVDFPIYYGMGQKDVKLMYLLESVEKIYDNYLNLPLDILYNSRFWHSLIIDKRDYVMELYGDEILKSYSRYRNIVMRKLDWENYIFKSIYIARALKEIEIPRENFKDFITKIFNNFDAFNYLLKTSIFVNPKFTHMFINAIENKSLSEAMKKRKKNDRDDGVSRLVIQELNLNYPMQIPHLLNQEELDEEVERLCNKYYKLLK